MRSRVEATGAVPEPAGSATESPRGDTAAIRSALETISSATETMGAVDLLSQQKVQVAVKQDTTREVEALLDRGAKIASFLRLGVKQHYGTRSEKLAEFDLLPFRGRAQPPKPPVTEIKGPETKAPGETAASSEMPKETPDKN